MLRYTAHHCLFIIGFEYLFSYCVDNHMIQKETWKCQDRGNIYLVVYGSYTNWTMYDQKSTTWDVEI